MRARPADYLLASSVALASLPVIGKRLEPLGGATAIALAAAAAIASARLAAEGWLVVAWLGRRIDRLDLSLERLN